MYVLGWELDSGSEARVGSIPECAKLASCSSCLCVLLKIFLNEYRTICLQDLTFPIEINAKSKDTVWWRPGHFRVHYLWLSTHWVMGRISSVPLSSSRVLLSLLPQVKHMGCSVRIPGSEFWLHIYVISSSICITLYLLYRGDVRKAMCSTW